MRFWSAALGLFAASVAIALAQGGPHVFSGSIADPAIRYSAAGTNTAIDALNKEMASGAVTLAHDERTGYLRAVLDALDVPIESQLLVYTKTSQQASWITPQNPRAIYFNDTTAIAWVPGAPLLEAWAQDPRQGTIFYTLSQTGDRAEAGLPRSSSPFERESRCLACHLAWETLAVPGPFVLTTFPREEEFHGADGFAVDHRDEIAKRWGGWYVTGKVLPPRHMGNLPLFMKGDPPPPVLSKPSLAGTVDLTGYLSPYSDIVALMVLEHQTSAMNMMTRLAWESRIGNPAAVSVAVNDLADYMVFAREARIPGRIEGSSGFAEKFPAMGPRDSKGRSLRDLQLDGRLMKYPLSYTIYSPAFDALPEAAKGALETRLREILAGQDPDPRYSHLTSEIRTAILEILKDTKGW